MHVGKRPKKMRHFLEQLALGGVALKRGKAELTRCDHHQSSGKGKVGDISDISQKVGEIRPNPWNQSQEIATTRCCVEKALILKG